MTQRSDVAIIGAGPHGLSLAAHLGARDIDVRIFGRPMTTWAEHMPKNMILKSDGFASNLSAPSPDSTLKAYCERRGIPYADQALPIPLDTFLAYADWFRGRYVPQLEQQDVTALATDAQGFVLTLESGEQVKARNVVLAVGISWFAYTPDLLAKLPASLVSHSFQHRDADSFKDRCVAVLGSGASAIDLAHLLHQSGAKVRIVARTPAIEYNRVPDAADETLLGRIQRPASGIGRGWRSLFCAQAPLLFYRLPQAVKARAIQSHMHPAAGWFMRECVEGVVAMSLGCTIADAKQSQSRVSLTLARARRASETLSFDHVIAATGYRADMRRLPFLSRELCGRIANRRGVPVLSDNFETAVDGLFAVGPAAIDSFGPLMRFMVGAEFAAPRVAARLQRKVGAAGSRRAA